MLCRQLAICSEKEHSDMFVSFLSLFDTFFEANKRATHTTDL